MRKLFEKLPQQKKRSVICAMVFLALFLLPWVLPLEDLYKLLVSMVLLIPLGLAVDGYWKAHKRQKNYEWLLEVADDSILDSFDLENYSTRPNVYVSPKALFDNDPYLVLPYSKVVWVYKQLINVKGRVVGQNAIFCSKDGKKVSLPCDDEAFQRILLYYVLPQSPDVMIGYSKENLKKYNQMKREKAWF